MPLNPDALKPHKLRKSTQGLWVSLSYPTVVGHRVDYTLGNLESKSIWTIPKYSWYYHSVEVLYKMVIPGSTLAALPITYAMRLYTVPSVAVIVCRRSITLPPSSAVTPPSSPSHRHCPPLLYIATNHLPATTAAAAQR